MQTQAGYGRNSGNLGRLGRHQGSSGHDHGVSHHQGQPSSTGAPHSQAVWINGYPGNRQEGFQGMTVQPLLEHQIKTFQQELA